MTPAVMLLIGRLIVLCGCLGALAAVTIAYPPTMIGILVVSTLIGVASLTTVKNRPPELFAAAALALAVMFVTTVDAIRSREYLMLIVMGLLVTGFLWGLQKPGWVPVAFSGGAVTMVLLLCWLAYRHRNEADNLLPEDVIRVTTIVATLCSVSLVQQLAGTTAYQLRPRKKQKKKTSEST